jgi:hypothetical protein
MTFSLRKLTRLDPSIVTVSLTRIVLAEASLDLNFLLGFSETTVDLPAFALALATVLSALPLRRFVTA